MNVTETDLTVAAAFYPILVECARQTPAQKLTYGELVVAAKERFPNLAAIKAVIPVSVGRRLDVVRMFLSEQNLPDLTSLVVNAATGEVGDAFGADPERTRAEVAAFDWSTVAEEFDLHVAHLRKSIRQPSKPKIKRKEALELMSAYHREYRATLPKEIASKREEIIELICNGVSPEEAFRNATV